MLELRNFKPESIDIFDEPIFAGTIYMHEKHISIISKYLDKTRCSKKEIEKMVKEDRTFPPAVEVDFLV